MGRKPSSMKNPIECHLWQMPKLTAEDLHGCFDTLEVFDDESHYRSCLLKCNKCGQLYYYEFHEEIDWAEGNDSAYRVYIPVETPDEVKMLLNSRGHGLREFSPRLVYSWPSDRGGAEVYWVGK